MDEVCGVGAYTAREPESGSRWPCTHQRDLATGSAKVPSTGFQRRTMRLEMMRSGSSRRMTAACFGGITLIAPVPKMESISFVSDAWNLALSDAERRLTFTSPDLLAANTPP
eukprot:9466906-Pyramimonas_sp.AAC.1